MKVIDSGIGWFEITPTMSVARSANGDVLVCLLDESGNALSTSMSPAEFRQALEHSLPLRRQPR